MVSDVDPQEVAAALVAVGKRLDRDDDESKIDAIYGAVKDGDQSVLGEVKKLNGRVHDIEIWKERISGAMALVVFLMGGGVVTAGVLLIIS